MFERVPVAEAMKIDPSTIPLIDQTLYNSLREAVDDMYDMAAETVAEYVNTLHIMRRDGITDETSVQNFSDWIHKIKGGLSMVACSRAELVCLQIEFSGKKGEFYNPQRMLQLFDANFDKVVQESLMALKAAESS